MRVVKFPAFVLSVFFQVARLEHHGPTILMQDIHILQATWTDLISMVVKARDTEELRRANSDTIDKR